MACLLCRITLRKLSTVGNQYEPAGKKIHFRQMQQMVCGKS